MRAVDIQNLAECWFRNRTVALIRNVTAHGLVRWMYVSLDPKYFPEQAARVDLIGLPADAEEIHWMKYVDQHRHPTLLLTFKTPASRAAASRPDPMQDPEWLDYLEKHGLVQAVEVQKETS